MFRRRNVRGRSFGRTNPSFRTTSCKEQKDWAPIEHFLYVYVHFLEYDEEISQEMGTRIASAISSWFPKEVLIESTISMEKVTETIMYYRVNYNGDKEKAFSNSLIFVKDWFGSDSEKLEIMLDEIWELIASDNKLSNREKQLFLTVSKAFNIKVDLE